MELDSNASFTAALTKASQWERVEFVWKVANNWIHLSIGSEWHCSRFMEVPKETESWRSEVRSVQSRIWTRTVPLNCPVLCYLPRVLSGLLVKIDGVQRTKMSICPMFFPSRFSLFCVWVTVGPKEKKSLSPALEARAQFSQLLIPVVSTGDHKATRHQMEYVYLLSRIWLCLWLTTLHGVLLSFSLFSCVLHFLQMQIEIYLFLKKLPHKRSTIPICIIWMRNWATERLRLIKDCRTKKWQSSNVNTGSLPPKTSAPNHHTMHPLN